MVDLDQKLRSAFRLGNQVFPNPVWLASGTAGFGEELAQIMDLNQLGGLVLKGTTLLPKEGNPTPRLVATPSGLLNSIGLQNPGLEVVLKDKLALFKKFQVPVILNIAGGDEKDYALMAKRIAAAPRVQAVEINLSCPNVQKVMDNGTDPAWVENVTRLVKKELKIPVIAKLTPNVTDITLLARAAENGGADAVSLINTLKGMAFNLKTQQPVLANRVGGLSGPAIRPIALRMVYETAQKIKIPIIGMGGITKKQDILEFFCAGATAVQIGTLSFLDLRELKNILSACADGSATMV